MNLQKASGIVALLAASWGCALSNLATPSTSLKSPKKIFVYESDGNGFNTKTIFYDNGEEVVAVDAQFTTALAEKSLAFLREKTQNPLTYLIITHPNPDKFNGIPVFQKNGAKVIASNETAKAMAGVHAYKKYYFVNIAKMFTEDTYPNLGTLDLTFDGKFDLVLNNQEKISLLELKRPGVSSTQTVVSIASANALIVGDLVHHKAHAWLEGGIVNGKPTPTISSWIQDLEDLSQTFGRENPIVYGGRGEAVALKIALPQQIKYLKAANKTVENYVKNLGAHRTELSGANSASHFGNIQKELEAQFPDYSLGYMIQYGVYGLALSK
jgi:glyoxylase-like metal-dependent hydrolase (beta-lactamase superfamily II)